MCTIIYLARLSALHPDENRQEWEGVLPCQTPTLTVRMKVEGCRVKMGGCRIKSRKWKVMCFWILSIWYGGGYGIAGINFIFASLFLWIFVCSLVWFPQRELRCAHESPMNKKLVEDYSCSSFYHWKVNSTPSFGQSLTISEKGGEIKRMTA